MTFVEYALLEDELSKDYSRANNNGDENGVLEALLKLNSLVSHRDEVSKLKLVKAFKLFYEVKNV